MATTPARHVWTTNMEYLITHAIYCFYETHHYHNSGVALGYRFEFVSAFVCVLFVALPAQYMQTVIGQYCESSATRLRHMAPLASGVAYSYLLSSSIRLLGEAIYGGDAILYFLNSMQTELPWLNCEGLIEDQCWFDETCSNTSSPCLKPDVHIAASYYWDMVFLGEDTWPDVRRFVTAVVIWTVVYLALFLTKGFTTRGLRYTYGAMIILRVIILIILLVESGINGFFTMLMFNYNNLLDANSWSRQMVATITFMSIGRGGNILLGSLFTLEHSSGTLTVFTLFGTFVMYLLVSEPIFISVEIIAARAGMAEPSVDIVRSIHEKVEFTLVPTALGYSHLPQFWSMIYFLALIIHITCHLILNVRMISLNIEDAFPHLVKYHNFFLAISLLLSFLLALPYVTKKFYLYLFPIMNYALDIFEMAISLIFVLIVGWVYGVQKLCDDVHYILGNQPTTFWKVTWYLNPVIIITGFIFYVLDPTNKPYDDIKGVIFVITIICILMFPVVVMGLYQILKYIRVKNFSGVFQMTDDWGPGDVKDRHIRRVFNPRKETKSRRRNEKCQHKCLLKSKVLTQVMAEESTWEMREASDTILIRDD